MSESSIESWTRRLTALRDIMMLSLLIVEKRTFITFVEFLSSTSAAFFHFDDHKEHKKKELPFLQ
jgi:hypothetical protein